MIQGEWEPLQLVASASDHETKLIQVVVMENFTKWWHSKSDGDNATDKINRRRWSRFRDGLSNLGTSIKPWLPPVNYITVHYTYFILLGLVFTLIFWGSSVPALSINFWDSLFLSFSALTSAGLNTVNVSGKYLHGIRPTVMAAIALLTDMQHYRQGSR